MHIYTSRDFTTLFIDHKPESLPVTSPYEIDSDARLRLLNGSVMRYTVGFIMQLSGLTQHDLPPRPGWDWGLHYDDNVATGHLPADAVLLAGRTAALIYFALSIAAMFGIGWQFGGRWTAYIASGLYVLNPIMLVNGRRALVESAMLGFGLLTIWIALELAKRRAKNQAGAWGWWLALIVSSALTLVSKYTGTIFVAGAFGSLLLIEIVRYFQNRKSAAATASNQYKTLAAGAVKLAISGLITLGLVVALSPALWNDPVSRVRDLGQMLQEQVEIVVSILAPEAPTTIPQRVEGIFSQPFLTPVAYFEQASWAEAAPITAEITAYNASPLSGIPVTPLIGIPLTLAAIFGSVTLFWPRLRQHGSGATSLVVLIWLMVTIANLLINPLPWQRYYLPLIPIAVLLAAIGIMKLITLLHQRGAAPSK